jgi:NAD-dependent DNA ligase
MARTTDNTDVWKVLDVMEITDALKGQRVCFTGHISLPRNQVQEIVRKAGGECHDSIKWNTTLLVTNKDWTANSVDGASSKFRKAQSNGTKIISEQKFIDYIVEHGKAVAGE